jgi:hypothetical protein
MSDPEPFNPMNLRLYVILRSAPILGFEVLHCGGNDLHSSSLMPLALDGRARCARQVFRVAVRVAEVLEEGRERDHYSEARELMERLDKKAVEELARKVAMHGPFDVGVDYSGLADVLLHLERTKDTVGAAWKLHMWLGDEMLKAPAFFGARKAECEALIGERRMAERAREMTGPGAGIRAFRGFAEDVIPKGPMAPDAEIGKRQADQPSPEDGKR